MSWTEERMQMLSELWAQGLSASQIASKLGGVTRNAVIGKAHRMGLQCRPSPIRTGGSSSRSRRRAADRRAASKVLATTVVGQGVFQDVPYDNPDEIEALTPVVAEKETTTRLAGTRIVNGAACAWPIGDPGDEGFRFCDDDPVPGRPYCSSHCEQAYINRDKPAARSAA
jgi:GcrA cell cycle regulator